MRQIVLAKRGDKVGIELRGKGPAAGNQFQLTFHWDDRASKKGFLSFDDTEPLDLHLGCMYRLKNGEQGVVHPIGKRYGSRDSPPFIHLDERDRGKDEGENLHILRPELIETVLIFALIDEGKASFSTLNGRLTIKDGAGREMLIRLDNAESRLKLCAMALIETQGSLLEIVKEERYFAGHDTCDRHYGFGFRWRAALK